MPDYGTVVLRNPNEMDLDYDTGYEVVQAIQNVAAAVNAGAQLAQQVGEGAVELYKGVKEYVTPKKRARTVDVDHPIPSDMNHLLNAPYRKRKFNRQIKGRKVPKAYKTSKGKRYYRGTAKKWRRARK